MKLLCIVGPTGVGKTAVACELCALLNGEIISADSMQIYRGLDIATAKPTREEQARARHHCIDIREPDEPYSAAQWAEDATRAIAEIRARGKTPIIAGGTGFYLRALLEPETLAAAPPNEELRAHWESELNAHDSIWLHDQLRTRDAAAAARLHPNDVRRVIRALEVAGSAPVQSSEAEVRSNSTVLQAQTYGLTMPREQLYARLEARIDAMIANGFREELQFAARYAPDLPSMQGVGYRQMRAALNDAALWDAGVAQWKRDSRRYAKRQMTWFRHQLATQWLDVTQFESPRAIATQIAQRWNEKENGTKS
jgi:tRNA dimethylallyltransferase